LTYTVIKSDFTQYITSINPPILAVASTKLQSTIPAAPDAKWVWANNCRYTNGPGTVTVTQTFRLSCSGPVTIYATADDSSVAYINGIKVLQTKNYAAIFSAIIAPQVLNYCGIFWI